METNRPTSIAWRLGYSAFTFGRNCVYEIESQEHKDWWRGYLDAKADFENERIKHDNTSSR